VPFELIPSDTHIDFIGKRHICVLLSIGLLVLSAAAVGVRGVKLGIDFAGGTELQVKIREAAVSDQKIRETVVACGVSEPSVVRFGGAESAPEYLIKFAMPTDEALAAGVGSEGCPLSGADLKALKEIEEVSEGRDRTGYVRDALQFALSNAVGPTDVLRTEFVGPRVGAELREDGIDSLLLASLAILIYIAFRFSTRFAPGAVVAVIHDVCITAGIFVMLGLEFDLRVLAALLAIIGYSLNDTIIIYDRIRENMERRTKFDLVDVLNRSVNQTLSRTVLTSGTTLASVIALLVLGGEVIRPFAIAMTIGIFVGTYSSIFIAAPTLLWLEQRFGQKA
jgi:preprotein translocase subunit SecF